MVNFKRGWAIGTNWAKLFFMNNYSKIEGWNELNDTKDFFIKNWKQQRNEFECAYRGMKIGYFNNFEHLEEKEKIIDDYDDFVEIKYKNLKIFYDKLQAKLKN